MEQPMEQKLASEMETSFPSRSGFRDIKGYIGIIHKGTQNGTKLDGTIPVWGF